MEIKDAMAIMHPTTNVNEIDQMATEYKSIGDQIKKLEEQKEELKAKLIAHDGQHGDVYQVSVTTYKSDRIESLKAIRDKSQALFDALHEVGAVKEVSSTRLNLKLIKS